MRLARRSEVLDGGLSGAAPNLREHGEQRVDYDGAKQSEAEHLGDHIRAN